MTDDVCPMTCYYFRYGVLLPFLRGNMPFIHESISGAGLKEVGGGRMIFVGGGDWGLRRIVNWGIVLKLRVIGVVL